MPEKPSYEELLQRIKQLEEESAGFRRMQKALLESEAQKRAILDASIDRIRCVDKDMRIIWANEETAVSLGKSSEELKGRFCYEIFLGGDAPCEDCPCKRAHETGCIERSIMYHASSMGVEGESFWDMYGAPLRDESGAIVSFIQIARNITEQKLAEQALRRREAVLEAISSAAVHALRGGTLKQPDIRELLACLGRAMEVSRAYVFRKQKEGDDCRCTSRCYEWTAPGVSPRIKDLQLRNGLCRSGGMKRWGEVLSQGRLICGHVRDFPFDEQERLLPLDIRSVVAVPIFVGQKWFGFVGFDQCGSERDWSRGEIDALKTASAILGALMERKEVEDDLFATRTRLQHLLECGPAVIYSCGRPTEKGSTFVSENVKRLLGYEPEEFSANLNFWAENIHPEDRGEVLTGLSTLTSPNCIHEYRFLHRDGTYRWIHDELNVIYDAEGRPKEGVGHWVDITARKRAEQALQKSEGELRFLSSRLLSAQEDERKRIARDLHDSTCQSLAFLKIALVNTLREMGEDLKARRSLDALIPLIPEMIGEIRRIITNLRPSMLDNLGLLPTITWLCKEFEGHGTIRIFEETGIRESELPEPLKIVIFRIVQEALSNTVRHSKAEIAKVILKKEESHIKLILEDNGEGFDMEGVLSEADSIRGIGLSSMRERVELTGGTFRLEASKGKGTRITASWP